MAGSPNKALLMLPLWWFARKLDSTDEDLVFKLKCSYYTVQCILFSLIIYLYTKALKFKESKKGQEKVFVPKPPEPFSNPEGTKKKYTEEVYGDHVLSTVRSLGSNAVIGTLIQTGLHKYKGIINGFVTQSIMAPLNFTDNAAVSFFLMGNENAFEVKSGEELTTNDEIVDKEGNVIVPSTKGVITSKKKEVKDTRKFEEIILDTWDMGAEADVKPFMKALKKGNVNFKTKENSWTPLMVMSGLGIKDVAEYLEKMKELGADPTITDAEGWNALHWSAFHGSADAARYILSKKGFDGISIGLHTATDNENMNALAHAEAEKNLDVRDVIEEYSPKENEMKEGGDDSGLRKRK